jgi:FtsH-binding integral membrane protein
MMWMGISLALSLAAAFIPDAAFWGWGKLIRAILCTIAELIAVYVVYLAIQLMNQYQQYLLGAVYIVGAGLAIGAALAAYKCNADKAARHPVYWMAGIAGLLTLLSSMSGPGVGSVM